MSSIEDAPRLSQNGGRDDGYRDHQLPPDHRTRRAGDRRGLRGTLPIAVPARPSWPVGEGAGSGRWRRRHLVLEPLPRRSVRLRKPCLLVHLLSRADARVGMVRTLSRPAGDHALPEFCRRPFRPEAGHSVQHPSRCRALRRGRESLAGVHRTGRDLCRQIPDHRRRLPVHGERTELPRLEGFHRATGTTPDNGRIRASISPASGWG